MSPDTHVSSHDWQGRWRVGDHENAGGEHCPLGLLVDFVDGVEPDTNDRSIRMHSVMTKCQSQKALRIRQQGIKHQLKVSNLSDAIMRPASMQDRGYLKHKSADPPSAQTAIEVKYET